jgi:hypothetical protein
VLTSPPPASPSWSRPRDDGGYDPKLVSTRFGHATIQFTLDVYVKPSAERQAAAAGWFAAAIETHRTATHPLPAASTA